jgi:hypothetical protein
MLFRHLSSLPFHVVGSKIQSQRGNGTQHQNQNQTPTTNARTLHNQQRSTTMVTMTAAISTMSIVLPLIALGLGLCTPTFGFHVDPNLVPPMSHNRHAVQPFHRRHFITSTRRLLSTDDELLSNKNSREEEMMDQVLMEQQFQRIQRESSQLPSEAAPQQQQRIDPLIASLTRIDEPTPNNVPMVQVPLFGEIPADGTLGLLAPAAAIGILGFIFSIVVAFNSRDSIVEGFSSVELPKMEYSPTVVEEGKCRGLCSSQAEDLDGLRNFMESISRR